MLRIKWGSSVSRGWHQLHLLCQELACDWRKHLQRVTLELRCRCFSRSSEAVSLKTVPVPSEIYRWNKDENKTQRGGKLSCDHSANVQDESPPSELQTVSPYTPELALNLIHGGKAYCTLRTAGPLSYTWICPLSSNIFSSLFSTEYQNKLIHSFIMVWNVFLYKILSLTLRLHQWKSRPQCLQLTAQ